MKQRLDIDYLRQWLGVVRSSQPFKNKCLTCGRWALSLLFGVVVLGLLYGLVAGYALGAESIALYTLVHGLAAAIIANVLAILWMLVAKKPSKRSVFTPLVFRPSMKCLLWFSFVAQPSRHPPRRA